MQKVKLIDNPMLFEQYRIVCLFVRHFAYYKAVAEKLNKGRVSGDTYFWKATNNAHLFVATLQWCKVFGANKENTHWKKTADLIGQDYDVFRHRIYSETSLSNQKKWDDYREQMVDVRNKYVAHFDMAEPYQGAVPFFDPALEVVYAYQYWIEGTIQIDADTPPLKTEYEKWRAKADSSIP